MKCEECNTEEAQHTLYKASTDDDERSNGPAERVRNLCDSCAREALESGEWEE